MNVFFLSRQRQAMAGLALVLFLSVSVIAKDAFTAIRARIAGAPGAAMTRVSVTIESYTTDEEAHALLQAQTSGGKGAVVRALKRMNGGLVSISGARQLHINAARVLPKGSGRRIVVICDGPLFSATAASPTQAAEEPFVVLELDVDDQGKGGGQLTEAATVRLDPNGFVELDRYLVPPQSLVEVKPCVGEC